MKIKVRCVHCGSNDSYILETRGEAHHRLCCFCGKSFDTLVSETPDPRKPSTFQLRRAQYMRTYRKRVADKEAETPLVVVPVPSRKHPVAVRSNQRRVTHSRRSVD